MGMTRRKGAKTLRLFEFLGGLPSRISNLRCLHGLGLSGRQVVIEVRRQGLRKRCTLSS